MSDTQGREPDARPEQTPAAPPTRPMRWLKYGSSVAVLVLATAAIVVMVNWIGYHRYVRLDFTHTRQYSLSEQTDKLLDQLESDIQITTLYADGTAPPELFRRVQDLLGEYQRRSGHVHVRQIDPSLEQDRFFDFTEQLSERFGGEIEANRETLGRIGQTYDEVRGFADEQTQALSNLLPSLPAETRELALVLPELNRVFMRIGDELDETQQQVEQTLSEEMPDFAAARSAAVEPLREFRSGVLEVALERFEAALDDPTTPDAVEDALLGMQRDYREMTERLDEVREEIEDLDSEGYDGLREAVRQTNSLVVAMDAEAAKDREDRGLIVLTLDEIYPNLMLSQVSQDEVRPEQGYKGEEVVSGAIMRMTLQHNTKVVFVNPSPRSVLDEGHPGSTYRLAAERLGQMNFEVDEWQPGGGVGPGGRPGSPEPRPTAEPGQTMVFVGLPEVRRSQQQGLQDEESPATAAIRDHVADGEPTLVILSAQPPTQVGETSPVLEPLAESGISVDASRVAMHHTTDSNGRVRGTTQIPVNEWSDAHPLTRAVRGLQGVVLQGVHMELAEDAPEDVQAWPIVQTSEDTWAGTDFFEAENARPGDSDPRGPLTVAAAATRDDDRVVVVGDRVFATDMVAQSGPQNVFGQVMFSQFPANQELFINSIYWLAGMDDLIAPGARTQDTRRIASVSSTQMRAVSWGVLAGMPLACLIAGLGVWLVRRQ